MARQQRQFPQGKYVLRSQNGSQNYAVYMYYYWKGKQVRHSVDLYVTPNDWNQDANGGAGEFRPSYGPNYKPKSVIRPSRNPFSCVSLMTAIRKSAFYPSVCLYFTIFATNLIIALYFLL